MDKARQQHALEAAKARLQFANEMEWANKMRSLDELRKAGAAMQMDPQAQEAFARLSTFGGAPETYQQSMKAAGAGSAGLRTVGSTGAAADASTNRANEARGNYNRALTTFLNPQIAADAQNTANKTSNILNENIGLEAAGKTPFMSAAGKLAGAGAILGAETDLTKKQGERDNAAARLAFESGAGRAAGQQAVAEAEARAEEANNRAMEAQAFRAAGGPEAMGRYNTPPTTIPGVDGELNMFNKWTMPIQDLQFNVANQNLRRNEAARREVEQQQAVDRFTEIINDKSTPSLLLPYLKYALAQAILGGRLSSLPGLNAAIMMRQGMGGGGLGGSHFGDINSGNEW